MRKLSMNSDVFYRRYGAFKAGTLLREAGFDAVDFSIMEIVKDDHPFLRDDYLEQAHTIREEFDKAGIAVNQAHAPFSFPLEKYLEKDALENLILPRTIRAMEMAAILGAENIIVHPIHYRWIGKEEAYAKNVGFYNVLIPYCEKFGIKVAVENMWDRDLKRGHIVHDTCSTKEEFISYIDGINNENIVACLDIGHVGLPLQDDEAHDFIYALGKDRLKALHIHDNNYQGDEHNMPFRGKLDWDAIGKALGEIGYEGDFTYEVGDRAFNFIPDSVMPSLLRMYRDVLKYIADVAEDNRP